MADTESMDEVVKELLVESDVAVAVADASIRIDIAFLDELVTLAGELVLARNEMLKFAASQRACSLILMSPPRRRPRTRWPS
jgi:chemotaxis protein histidine kinase CheA